MIGIRVLCDKDCGPSGKGREGKGRVLSCLLVVSARRCSRCKSQSHVTILTVMICGCFVIHARWNLATEQTTKMQASIRHVARTNYQNAGRYQAS